MCLTTCCSQIIRASLQRVLTLRIWSSRYRSPHGKHSWRRNLIALLIYCGASVREISLCASTNHRCPKLACEFMHGTNPHHVSFEIGYGCVSQRRNASGPIACLQTAWANWPGGLCLGFSFVSATLVSVSVWPICAHPTYWLLAT